MKPLILASQNAGKLKEFQAILAKTEYQLIPMDSSGPSGEETGLTFVENALIKARAIAKYTQMPTLADDSGLIVPALNGAPGIYSARFAGMPSHDKKNCEKLLDEMHLLTGLERQAYFYCVIVLLQHESDPTPIIAEGFWHGIITEKPMGNNGFGYDPIFFIPSLNKTSAELMPDEKNRYSHRAMALDILWDKLKCDHR